MALEPVLKSAAQVDWARVRARDGHQTSGTSRSAEFFPSARLVESEQLALFPLEILLRSLTRNEETRLWQYTHPWPDDLRTRFVAADSHRVGVRQTHRCVRRVYSAFYESFDAAEGVPAE